MKKLCSIVEKDVEVITKECFIKDGNSLFPSASRTLIIDCKEKNCRNYNICKISKFDALN